MDERRDDRPVLRIGPGGAEDAPPDEARAVSPAVRRVLGRLAIAAGIIAVLAVVFFLVLPRYGLALPPLLPWLCFAAIALGTLLSAAGNEGP
jgi:hypothetical protein